MFKIIHLDGTQQIPDDDICYILAKDGIYLKKKVGLIESLTPVKSISILQEIKPYAKINIPKINGKDFGKVMSFFKAVYEEYKSEAIVLLYYNSKTKKYKILVPPQKVSGASLDYTKGIIVDNYIQIGTIHSHANFSAFHSGVDDNDEEHFDGIHITIGDNMSEFPSISASMVVNGTRFVLTPTDYINDLELVEYTPYFPHMFRPSFVEINGEKEYKSNVKSKIAYKLIVSEKDKEFPSDWMDMVEGTKYEPLKYTQTDYLDLWGNMDMNLGGDVPPLNYKENYSYTRYTPPVQAKNKFDPCSSCAFKKYNRPTKEETKEEKNIKEEEKDIQEGFSKKWNLKDVIKSRNWWGY